MSTLKDNAQRYGLVSQILHWGMAGIIIFTFISGEIFVDAAREEKAEILNRHATAAILFIAFLAFRALWRTSQPDPDELNQNKWLMRGHKAAVLALYAIPLALAITGSLTVLSAGFPVPFFGQDLVMGWDPANKGLHDVVQTVHNVLTKLLVVVFLGHVLAAFWHQFIKRDGVLSRMLPMSLKASTKVP